MKKQIKKSLSLFMAVLMLLSCWVWVAPEKAEAAGAEDGQYYFKWVIGKIEEAGNSGNWKGNELTINYIKADGTDGSTTISLNKDTYNDEGATNAVVWEGWIDGFPTWAGWYMKMEWKAAASVYLNADDCYYAVGTSSSNVQQVSNIDSFKWQNNAAGQGTKDATFGLSTQEGKDPKITTINNGPAATETVTIPKINTAAEDKPVFSSNFSVKCYDQYGVRITDSTELEGLSLGLKTDKSDALDLGDFTKEDTGLWYANGNVWYNKDAQVLMLRKSGYSYHLYAHFTSNRYGDKNQFLSTITLNYPPYTVSVDQHGSISGLMASMDMSDGNSQTDTWSYTGIYQGAIPTYPKGVASKDGYNFEGFWTVPQPSSGVAGYNAFEAEFANPVSSKDFVGVYGGEENGTYVVKDGKTYYNAGTRLTNENNKEILGDVTYYGWWNAKDVSVKFYDIDGTYLGTQTSKFGKIEGKGWYPDPKDGYVSGAYEYQGFAEQWRDITGAVIHEGEYTFGPLSSLSLTPIYEEKTYSDKYTVNFMNTYGFVEGGANQDDGIASGKYAYRHILSGDNIPQLAVPYGVDDAERAHRFSGWSTQKPASGNYHVVAEGDASFVENTDWVVREDITYYPVYRYTVKEYAVSFTYFDATGAEKTDIKYVPYGSIISTPDNVNRTYALGGYGYDLEGWEYMNSSYSVVVLGVDDDIVLNTDNFALSDSNLSEDDPVMFASKYGKPQPTPYTVTFKYMSENGVEKSITAEVFHGSKISTETVAALAVVPAEYDDGTALYKFADKWIVEEGTADKTEYTASEFTSFAPTSHVTFKAAYGEGTPFYTVKYVDGALSYSERVLAGSTVPAWMIGEGEEATEYTPSKANSETGEYKFEGWFDEKQADASCAATNGNNYTASSIVDSDLVLYPQFKFSPFKYIIKFMNFDGTVQLAAAEVEAGQSYGAAFYEAQRAAQSRPADKEYSYTFIGWDQPYDEDRLVCEGKDVTFIAQYRPSYVYYKANWYNSKLVDGKWVATGDALATTSYTYEGAVYAPSVDLVIPAGKVFAGWYYMDGETEKAYQRGMTITADMSFYAKYDDAPVSYTVTAVVNGEEIKYQVAENKTAEVVGNPLDGYVDETKHNKFEGWFTTADYTGTKFSLDTVITENITIYAKFTETAHNKDQKELITAPTYYAEGSEKRWCACSTETAETVVIPMLTDTVAPTGTIYLGGQSWSSTGNPAYLTDNDPISVFVNKDSDIVITTNDKGDVNAAYNPAGNGIGIRVIRAFAFPANTVLTAENFGAAQAIATEIFRDNTNAQNTTANYTTTLSEIFVAELDDAGKPVYEGGKVKFKALEDGEDYIVYYYVNDKANENNGAPATGNQLNRLVRTAKFTYDNTAPEYTVDGDSNAATAASTATYCGKAIIKGIENGATVTVNGEKVTLTTAGVSGKTAYTIDEAGNYIIKVTDRAGNTSTKKIIVAAGHNEVITSKEVTCTENGYEKIECAVCKKVIKNETTEAEGHKYGKKETVAPTCVEGGYNIEICTVCGYENKTNNKPAADHTPGSYIVVTPATCSTVGKKISNCTVCGKNLATETIPVDTVNGHKYGAVKVLKATCDKDGEEYKTCKYCFGKITVKTLPKLDHKDTGRYTKVTTAATCKNAGVETTYCKACDTVMGTTEIPATGNHIWVASTDPEKTFEATAEKDGQITYECQTCDETEIKKISKIEKFTVTFYGEDGTTKLFEIPAVVKGTTISKDYTWNVTTGEGEDAVTETKTITEPTKASDLEYNYTFAGWTDLEGNAVKFPFDLTANTSLKATFTAVKRTYTHIFKVDAEDSAAFATIVGVYGDINKKPTAVPTKQADEKYTYEFEGWVKVEEITIAEGEEVQTEKIFLMEGDATFIAKFKPVVKTYNVNFYVGDDLYKNIKVDGGKKASATFENPAKAADDNAHYTFAGWYADKSLTTAFNFETEITDNIRVYAKFISSDHVYAVDEDGNTVYESVTAATCTKEGEGIKKCTVCEREAKDILPKASHSYVEQADGSKICSACGDKIAAEIKEVVITFIEKVGTTTKEIKRYEAAEGKIIEFTAPEKSDTAQYDYEFINWTDADGKVVGTEAKLTVTAGTADAAYTANYSAVVRTYFVTYFDADYNILQSTEVEYGSDIPAYTGAEPTKAPGTTDHYAFDGWSTDLTAKVKGQLDITPKFDPESHDGHWVDGASNTPATCTQDGTINKKCSVCGLEIPSAVTSKATGHDYECIEDKPADYGVPGYKKYVCHNNNCPEKEKEEIIPALTYKKLTVTVKDGEKLVYGIGVDIYKDGVRVNAETAFTNNNGVVVFENLKDGKYTVLLEGGKNAVVTVKADTEATLNITEDSPSGDTQKPSCSCSCHRNGFWGVLFRFFHTFISWFTGRVNCCSNPDSRY